MKNIKIEWLHDEYDCDTCGSTWSEGAIVTMPDGKIIDLSPSAHCYLDVSYDEAQVYQKILSELGYSINAE